MFGRPLPRSNASNFPQGPRQTRIIRVLSGPLDIDRDFTILETRLQVREHLRKAISDYLTT